MESLNAGLAALRAEKEAARDPARTRIMHRATEELRASGILDHVLAVGSRAPRFTRPDLEGREVSLERVLARGPAVLSFFRGRW